MEKIKISKKAKLKLNEIKSRMSAVLSDKNDNINHPKYYIAENGMEVIDIIEAFKLDFHSGAAIKYILRAGKKDDEIDDLKKAVWFLQRKIKNLGKTENPFKNWNGT